MTETVEKAKNNDRGLIMGVSGLIIGGLLAALFVLQLNDTQDAEAIKSDKRAETDIVPLSEQCSSASLISGPTSHQLACLMDVKKTYGSFDCQAHQGFETRLRADVERCEAKISACLTEEPVAHREASLRSSAEKKSKIIVKREPAKLVQLGRSEPASETGSYFIQCHSKGMN